MDLKRISSPWKSIAAVVSVSSALLCLPLTAQSPGPGGPPKTGTLTKPPGALKPPPVITPPPFAPPKRASAPSLPGPTDFGISLTWRVFPDGVFESAHPYQNNMALWKEVSLPQATAKARFFAVGTFQLEDGYDYLHLFGVHDSKWRHLKSYTGTVGPARAEEFEGSMFYFKLETDYSVAGNGFKLAVEVHN